MIVSQPQCARFIAAKIWKFFAYEPTDPKLNDFGAALSAFCDDLKRKGIFDRVVVMTFSEFGRRVTENANGGTDHGTAAPLFVCGGGVKPGLTVNSPRLINSTPETCFTASIPDQFIQPFCSIG
jgi:Protein of unknown function (DUF1501)